jgi:hypothetical protein
MFDHTEGKVNFKKFMEILNKFGRILRIDIETEWLLHKSQIPLLVELSFERRVLIDDLINVQLHGFCDASKMAYRVCLYIRSANKNETCITRLLWAKSKMTLLNSKVTISTAKC